MHRTDANSGHLEPPSAFMDVAGAQDEMDLPTALRSFLLSQWEKAPRTQDIYREAVMALARLQPGPVKRIRPEDINALFQACRTYMWVGMRDAAILWTLWTTPARVGELCALTVEDIDWQQAVLHFRRAKGGNQYRAVLFPPCLQAPDRYLP